MAYLDYGDFPIFDNVTVYLKEKEITKNIIADLFKPFKLILKELKRIYGQSYSDHVRKTVFTNLKELFGEENILEIEEVYISISA